MESFLEFLKDRVYWFQMHFFSFKLSQEEHVLLLSVLFINTVETRKSKIAILYYNLEFVIIYKNKRSYTSYRMVITRTIPWDKENPGSAFASFQNSLFSKSSWPSLFLVKPWYSFLSLSLIFSRYCFFSMSSFSPQRWFHFWF